MSRKIHLCLLHWLQIVDVEVKRLLSLFSVNFYLILTSDSLMKELVSQQSVISSVQSLGSEVSLNS